MKRFGNHRTRKHTIEIDRSQDDFSPGVVQHPSSSRDCGEATIGCLRARLRAAREETACWRVVPRRFQIEGSPLAGFV
jgi:hypothetical protein